jgi:ubiquinone/menaquinone biosynthesis C-methylase UbiE
MLAALIAALPFVLYRLTSQRQPGFLATLSLPLWGTAFAGLPYFAASPRTGAISFLVYWFAAVINWMWNQEFQAKKIATGAGIFGGVCVLVLGYGFYLETHSAAPVALVTNPALAWICFAGALILSAWSLMQPGAWREVWANKTETVALLRSPYTRDSLQVVTDDGHEVLVSPSGERFPVRNGIPIFLEAEKLTGSNQKYNHLYETIGGFYDDSQRVVCGLHGISPEQYFLSYLRLLEISPGDSVLETSVGTGLNFKYLPAGVRLFGLDLSAEMLARCQDNLRRWGMRADLFLGNAEDLPFANDSFDVVFHVGGINFFNDRAKAILEMIRVAKPGSRILIADETEEHVKGTYERIPITSGYFKNRQETVAAPVDLVPPEMQEINLEILRDGQFYALTFRKPSFVMPSLTRSNS